MVEPILDVRAPTRSKFSSEGKVLDRSAEMIKNISELNLDAVVVCGGEDTLGVAAVWQNKV